MVLQDGQSFAISGLLNQRTQDTLAKTPGIASIPILGELFKSKNTNHSISELIVIVTPEIVDPMQQKVTPSAPPPPITITDTRLRPSRPWLFRRSTLRSSTKNYRSAS